MLQILLEVVSRIRSGPDFAICFIRGLLASPCGVLKIFATLRVRL